MPLYEYNCTDCGHHFDSLRSMKDADKPIQCRNCHGEQTKRALSVFFSSSEGRSLSETSSGCGGCSGGSCSSCGSH